MGADREILFAQTLEAVRKQAGRQQNCISKQEIKDAFQKLDLSEEQLELVFDYLKKQKIGIDEPVNPDDYLSGDEVDYLEEYQKGLAWSDEISEGEKEAVILSAMAGEKEARQKLIHLFLPKVVEVSKLYTGQGVFLEDLIGEGNVALSEGVTMIGCLEHAREAEGMLMKMIMDAMEACIAENMEEADKDKKVAEHVNQVAERAKEFAGELHRKVTVDELARETGMPKKMIQDAMRMSGFTIEDLEG